MYLSIEREICLLVSLGPFSKLFGIVSDFQYSRKHANLTAAARSICPGAAGLLLAALTAGGAATVGRGALGMGGLPGIFWAPGFAANTGAPGGFGLVGITGAAPTFVAIPGIAAFAPFILGAADAVLASDRPLTVR